MKKEIEEAIRIWKDLPNLLIDRINILKIAILPGANYRFKSPIKMTTLFTDLENTILNFIYKDKTPRTAIAILNNKRIAGSMTIPDFKLY